MPSKLIARWSIPTLIASMLTGCASHLFGEQFDWNKADQWALVVRDESVVTWRVDQMQDWFIPPPAPATASWMSLADLECYIQYHWRPSGVFVTVYPLRPRDSAAAVMAVLETAHIRHAWSSTLQGPSTPALQRLKDPARYAPASAVRSTIDSLPQWP